MAMPVDLVLGNGCIGLSPFFQKSSSVLFLALFVAGCEPSLFVVSFGSELIFVSRGVHIFGLRLGRKQFRYLLDHYFTSPDLLLRVSFTRVLLLICYVFSSLESFLKLAGLTRFIEMLDMCCFGLGAMLLLCSLNNLFQQYFILAPDIILFIYTLQQLRLRATFYLDRVNRAELPFPPHFRLFFSIP
jgi:hypothetical protein